MPGLGTVINVAAIIAGGLIGLLFGSRMSESMQDAFIKVCGLTTLFIAISGAMEEMLSVDMTGLSSVMDAVLSGEASSADASTLTAAVTSSGSMMLILCMVIGVFLGELLRIEDRLEQFGEWLKEKSGNAKDNGFVNAFVTASLTVCVGAMAIVGSIQDGISADPSVLMAKAVLDFVIIIIMAASMGKGAVFSAIPVAILQGGITLLARIISPVMTEAALSNLSLVGSVMIFCVGVNLIWDKPFKVGNMLPALIIAVIWAFLPV